MESFPEKSPQINYYDQDRRDFDDVTTWLAEAIDGHMRSQFEYSFDGSELLAQDGGRLGPVFDNAIYDARTLAKTNPKLSFELGRREKEREEYEYMLDMAANPDAPNTMVVVSDFPEELMDAEEDIGGYNVRRKQTMLRVISRTPEGKINVTSQSLDKSDRRSLENIYYDLGCFPEPGELLGQRVHLDLPPDEQDLLVDRLTGVYDRSLSSIDGGEHYAGRSSKQAEDTYKFVLKQEALIRVYMQSPSENRLLGLASILQEDYDQQAEIRADEYPSSDYSDQVILQTIDIAAQNALARGTTFSGCGASIGGGPSDQLSELGYGNKSAGEDRFGSLKFDCPSCGYVNEREPGKLIECCQSCNGDVSC